MLGPLESILSEYQRRVDGAIETAELYATGVSTRYLKLVAANLGINAETRLRAERLMLVVMEADGARKHASRAMKHVF